MTKKLGNSLHDFFDNVSVDETDEELPKHSQYNGLIDYRNTFADHHPETELHTTLSNEDLIDGYVVIQVLDVDNIEPNVNVEKSVISDWCKSSEAENPKVIEEINQVNAQTGGNIETVQLERNRVDHQYLNLCSGDAKCLGDETRFGLMNISELVLPSLSKDPSLEGSPVSAHSYIEETTNSLIHVIVVEDRTAGSCKIHSPGISEVNEQNGRNSNTGTDEKDRDIQLSKSFDSQKVEKEAENENSNKITLAKSNLSVQSDRERKIQEDVSGSNVNATISLANTGSESGGEEDHGSVEYSDNDSDRDDDDDDDDDDDSAGDTGSNHTPVHEEISSVTEHCFVEIGKNNQFDTETAINLDIAKTMAQCIESDMTVMKGKEMKTVARNKYNRVESLKREHMNRTLFIPLSETITECLDLRLTPDHMVTKKTRKVKADTPYPLQISVKTANIPSEVFGDGPKPAITECEDVVDNVDTPVTEVNTSRLRRYSTELDYRPTPALPGKISETPRFSSVIREISMRPVSGAATDISDSSGRKNPQAKADSEIRDVERVAHAGLTIKNFQGVSSARRPLPPIHTVNGSLNHRNCDTKIRNCDIKVKRKPAVPRLLRSTVCYQEGKMDVSIYSDRSFTNQSDPVHLNINFVRQPSTTGPEIKSAGSKPQSQQNEKRAGKSGVDDGISKQRNRTGITRQRVEKKPEKYLAPINNTPKVKDQMPKKIKQSGKMKNKSRNKKSENSHKETQRKVKVSENFWSRKFTLLDWNIVERRAQKPPFNTHIDEDASFRHQQFFMDY